MKAPVHKATASAKAFERAIGSLAGGVGCAARTDDHCCPLAMAHTERRHPGQVQGGSGGFERVYRMKKYRKGRLDW